MCVCEKIHHFYFGLMSACISILVSSNCEGLKLSDKGGDICISTAKDRQELYEQRND